MRNLPRNPHTRTSFCLSLDPNHKSLPTTLTPSKAQYAISSMLRDAHPRRQPQPRRGPSPLVRVENSSPLQNEDSQSVQSETTQPYSDGEGASEQQLRSSRLPWLRRRGAVQHQHFHRPRDEDSQSVQSETTEPNSDDDGTPKQQPQFSRLSRLHRSATLQHQHSSGFQSSTDIPSGQHNSLQASTSQPSVVHCGRKRRLQAEPEPDLESEANIDMEGSRVPKIPRISVPSIRITNTDVNDDTNTNATINPSIKTITTTTDLRTDTSLKQQQQQHQQHQQLKPQRPGLTSFLHDLLSTPNAFKLPTPSEIRERVGHGAHVRVPAFLRGDDAIVEFAENHRANVAQGSGAGEMLDQWEGVEQAGVEGEGGGGRVQEVEMESMQQAELRDWDAPESWAERSLEFGFPFIQGSVSLDEGDAHLCEAGVWGKWWWY